MNSSNKSYTFSISPNDCYLVSPNENLSSLPKTYKQAQKRHQLYRIVDRIDLSLLPNDAL